MPSTRTAPTAFNAKEAQNMKEKTALDPVISKPEKIILQSRAMLKAAPSLRPGLAMMDGCLVGNPEAIAIRDSWAFSFPIRRVEHNEYEIMAERGQVTFCG
jgi:hypothetical protein